MYSTSKDWCCTAHCPSGSSALPWGRHQDSAGKPGSLINWCGNCLIPSLPGIMIADRAIGTALVLVRSKTRLDRWKLNWVKNYVLAYQIPDARPTVSANLSRGQKGKEKKMVSTENLEEPPQQQCTRRFLVEQQDPSYPSEMDWYMDSAATKDFG